MQTARRRPRTILVVEDEPATLFVIKHFLEESGFEVLCAASGGEACALLTGAPAIDAVFSDVRLPDINGYQLAHWIRRDHPRLPIVLGSGGGLAHDSGGRDFVFFLKPYDLEKVARHLHSLLEQNDNSAGAASKPAAQLPGVPVDDWIPVQPAR